MKQSNLYFYLASTGCLILLIALPLAARKEWIDTSLMIAIASKDNKAVRAALDAGANPNTDQRHLLLSSQSIQQSLYDEYSSSCVRDMLAIRTAAQTGRADIVETLLKGGANVNSVNKEGERPPTQY